MVISRKENIFNSKIAIFLAAMSYQTYPLFLEEKLTLPKGFDLQYTISAFANIENPTEEVFGFIAESQDTIVIAFRGYVSYPTDLLAGYDVFQVPYSFVENGGKTHRGFTCIYESTRENLIKELSNLSETKTLFVTGHNYGGALATLAALDIAENTRFKSPIVYTYGSLRVGDHEFASQFNEKVKNSIRIFNVHDTNPTFPARAYPPPYTKEGIYYRHVKNRYPISFQLNDTPRNDGIGCYFKKLSGMNSDFAKALCSENPGFCPNSEIYFPFQGTCNCPTPCVEERS